MTNLELGVKNSRAGNLAVARIGKIKSLGMTYDGIKMSHRWMNSNII